MALISRTNIPDDTVADAADVNNDLNQIYDEFNGNIEAANIASNAVTTDKVADGAVTNAKLSTTVGEVGGAWQDWTPTYANLTVGNGTVVAKYKQIGKTVHFIWTLVCGSTTTIATGNTISIPVPANSVYGTTNMWTSVGLAAIHDISATTNVGDIFIGQALLKASTTVVEPYFHVDRNATAGTTLYASNGFPILEASGDVYTVQGTYEAA